MLSILLNFLYLVALAALSPWLLWKAVTTGKYRRGILPRLIGTPHLALRFPQSPVWFHGVSVGEIHLLRPIIAQFRLRHPDIAIVVSSTTETGLAEAHRLFPDGVVIRWPLDFSWAVGRLLAAVRPQLVVLAEGDLWPNFLLAAKRRHVPVVVVNARMSPKSFGRLRRMRILVRVWMRLLAHVAVQTLEYAAMFERLGVPRERVRVTGSVKYDRVQSDRDNPTTAALRRRFRIQPGDLVWVAGSTAAPEEQICLQVFQNLRRDFPALRLILVPRQKERFDEVAKLLDRSSMLFVRRSKLGPIESAIPNPQSAIMLLDTIGELSAAWGLADVAFVGGSLDGRRGGQNMIEPAAYGAAVLIGPHTWNFRETVQQLLDSSAAIQVRDAAHLEEAIRSLLSDENRRRQIGDSARQVVLACQGATSRTLDMLNQFLDPRVGKAYAA